MPVELHERLSEFSYGYGVTREVERQLRQQGLRATPFLPSLLHEASLGFDVAFDRPGVPLLLQFKLGQAMRRFVPSPRPTLQKPFWRYRIDTAEPDGQFELLLKAELDGADAFYVAPMFHDWEIYLEAFEHRHVLLQSLVVSPGEIRRTLTDNDVADGEHRIVYDEHNTYLCSKPLKLASIRPSDIAGKLRSRVESRKLSIGKVIEEVFKGFQDRSAIRRPRQSGSRDDPDRTIYSIPSDQRRQATLRQERMERIIGTGRNREQAIALAVGAEVWSSGAQLIFVTEPPTN